MSDSKVVTTIKGGTEYDAPWVVVHADSANEARDILGELEASGLFTDVGRLSGMLQAQYRMGKHTGATPVDAPQAPPQQSWGSQGTQQYQQPPQAPQQPQQGGWQGQQQQGANPADNKQCIHGPMVFRQAGIAKRTGQPYAAFWGCGSNVKGCKPIN